MLLLVALWGLLAFTPALANPDAALAGGLNQLVAAYETGDPRLTAHLKLHVTSDGGDPLVLVHLAPGADAAAVLQKLTAAGFRLTAKSSINPSLFEGYLPLAAVRSAAGVAGIHSLHATQRPVKHAGAVQSQAVALQKADIVQAHGIDGAGIRLGALSDSFDTCAACATHAADDVVSGDLPGTGVTVLEDSPGGTDEGRAMLQLVHDIAPGSQLGFATAFSGLVGFSENILALRSQFKADVITDDVIYFDEPMYSDGLLAQTVDAVTKSGAAYFSSAGNNGLEAYESVYRPVSFTDARALVAAGHGNVHLEQIPAAIRPQSVHDFKNPNGSTSITQRFTTDGSNQIAFEWDEPFFLGLVKTDFNIYVFDKDGNWMDPASAAFPGFYTTDDNTLTDEAFEYVNLVAFPGELHGGANASDYQLVIGNVNGGPATHIKYVNVNGLGVSERQGAPSTWGHAAARNGQGVAATYYAIPNFPEDYSAPGPVTIYLDAQGNRLAQPEVRRVPQITAADGVDTTFFGFDSDGNGLPNFFGTSAAAPNAAATAALVLQAAGGSGSLSPSGLYHRLQDGATPILVPNNRSFAAANAGPVTLRLSGDWTRQNRYFNLSVSRDSKHAVASVTFDAAPAGLIWSTRTNRFHIGVSNGVTDGDITRTPAGSVYALQFAPGKFGSGGAFTFGMSVFNPIQGSTQEDPDRFRGMTMTVILDNGKSYTGTVYAGEREDQNVFTGAGLLNAARSALDD